MIEPTPEQAERATRVHRAIAHELELAAREGASPAEMLAGMGAAIAALVTATAGEASVALWFDRQARLVRELQGRGH